jgi:hypothetical protein
MFPFKTQIRVGVCALACSLLLARAGCEEGSSANRSRPDESPYDASPTAYVVYYVGSSSCGVCDDPKLIESINRIESSFSSHHDSPVKTVMVVMDKQIDKGMRFVDSYDLWDEVSIGSFYRNELLLEEFNDLQTPGVPHVLVFKDTYAERNHGIPVRTNRTLVASVLGGENIIEWVNRDMPLKKP